MGDFFHGWHRKTGVVTLVMACLLVAGWMRSFVETDKMILQDSRKLYAEFLSHHGGLELGVVSAPNSEDFRRPYVPRLFARWMRYQTESTGTPRGLGRTVYNGTELNEMFDGCTLTIWRFPYWGIVLPVTLLSAHLLLTRRKPSTAKTTAQSIPDKLA